MKNLFFFLVFLLSVSGAFAQRYATSDSKAIKYYEQAYTELDAGKVELAEARLAQAIKRDSTFIDALVLQGQIDLEQRELQEAKKWFQKAIAADPSYDPIVLFILGNLELNDGHYQEAKSHFTAFLGYDYRSEEANTIAQRAIASCDFAIDAMAHPVDFDPVNLGDGVNSPNPEYFPAITADESMLLFTRLLQDRRTPSGYNEDFFFSEKVNGQWIEAYNPGSPINSLFNEGAPTLSPDGKYIIFTSCEIDNQYGPGRRGLGSCDLFIAERIGKGWSNPRNMGRTINSPRWETQPSFSSDGKTLYFVRGKFMGSRDADIYTSTLVNGRWSEAVPLPDIINSPEAEESVFIHPDNQTLYFSSRGHLGMGGLDIFLSRKDSNGRWTEPVNIGYPINTHRDENSFHVAASGKMAFFSSDREGGNGLLDLYTFELPEALRPNQVTYLRGQITDAKTGKPLEARFELIDLESNEVVVQSYSDEANGRYLVCIPVDRRYALNANLKGYLFHSENFELEGVENITHYEKNIELQPIEAGRSVVLRNVFFDTDKYNLKPASKVELNRLVDLMEENPQTRIEVSGHTDSQGSAQSNQVLSENRAKAVYDYLVEKGIDPARLTYTGHGQEKPIASNETEEGRAQNRRTEFQVIE